MPNHAGKNSTKRPNVGTTRQARPRATKPAPKPITKPKVSVVRDMAARKADVRAAVLSALA